MKKVFILCIFFIVSQAVAEEKNDLAVFLNQTVNRFYKQHVNEHYENINVLNISRTWGDMTGFDCDTFRLKRTKLKKNIVIDWCISQNNIPKNKYIANIYNCRYYFEIQDQNHLSEKYSCQIVEDNKGNRYLFQHQFGDDRKKIIADIFNKCLDSVNVPWLFYLYAKYLYEVNYNLDSIKSEKISDNEYKMVVTIPKRLPEYPFSETRIYSMSLTNGDIELKLVISYIDEIFK